jgi:hypothetical protein
VKRALINIIVFLRSNYSALEDHTVLCTQWRATFAAERTHVAPKRDAVCRRRL